MFNIAQNIICTTQITQVRAMTERKITTERIPKRDVLQSMITFRVKKGRMGKVGRSFVIIKFGFNKFFRVGATLVII